MASYSLAETARILRIAPARLRYWERTALVRPSASRGDRPAFVFRDLVSLRVVVGLLERGVPLRRIRHSVDRLRERVPELSEPLGALRVWLEGSDRVVVRHAGALIEPDGQLVLDLAAPEGVGVTELPGSGGLDAPRPSSPLAWFELGSRLDTDPRTHAQAERAYRSALELDPGFADAHCNLGTLHYNRGDREQARVHYQAALALEPQHLEAHFNLGNLLEEMGRREAALRHYKLAVRSDPLFADAHLNLALLYERLGLRRGARACWRRYLQLVPRGPWSEIARERLEERRPER